MEGSTKVDDLVRKAIVVATKLKLDEFRTWCEKELHGYGKEDVPAYRRVSGLLKAMNPFHGWIPVVVGDAEMMDLLSSRDVGQSVAELEHLLSGKDEGGRTLQIPLPHNILMKVFGDTREFQLGMVPTLLVSSTEIHGILDSVRNAILEWSLKLEAEGVLGEGMTFSRDEVQKASTITYNIQGFSGILGNVTNSQVQVGNYNSIRAALKRHGIPQDERNEIEEILDGLPEAKGPQRAGLARRGTEWLMRNGSAIGSLSDTIRGWVEPYLK